MFPVVAVGCSAGSLVAGKGILAVDGLGSQEDKQSGTGAVHGVTGRTAEVDHIQQEERLLHQ